MRAAKHKFFVWIDSRTGAPLNLHGNDVDDLSGCVAFSTEVVRTAIRANLLPLRLLSKTPLFDRIITPSAVQALEIALEELDKCQENTTKVLQEIIEKEAQNQPTE